MKKTTVVFDLDGTLLDTLQDLANAVNYALEHQGMPKRTLEEVRQFVGNGVRLLMIRAVPDGESNPLFEETFALFKDYYGEHCNDNTKPYAGVVELIETLKKKGYAVAIVSNKIDFAVNVEVPDENIIRRMSGRRACVSCGSTYHVVYAPTKVDGICDRCGKELILRDDDKPETVQNRLNVYHKQTQPLIDFYKNKGVLAEVDGTVDMEDVFNAIVKILG